MIDHARRRSTQHRTGLRLVRLEARHFQNLPQTLAERPEQVVVLIDAWAVLAKTHPQWAAMIQHRSYRGLTIEQRARLLGIGKKTVQH